MNITQKEMINDRQIGFINHLKRIFSAGIIALLLILTSYSGNGSVTITSSITFTTCGATGRQGPNQTQVNSTYTGTNLAGAVTVTTTGIQKWVVPQSGTYNITVKGAQGGNYPVAPTSDYGQGAIIRGKVQLTAGTVLWILVGQKGIASTTNVAYNSAGGGGGTFIATGSDLSSSTPLIIAGGGGGGNSYSNIVYLNGSTTTSGIIGSDGASGDYTPGAGGTNGSAGGNNSAGTGSVASGFYGSGTSSQSFQTGGLGAYNTFNSGFDGGFGGGGTGLSDAIGGGGGGYSGGGASDFQNGYCNGGGGGGSFVASGFSNIATSNGYYNGTAVTNLGAYNLGAGSVVIEPDNPVLTISSSGDTGSSGTYWSLSGNTLNVTGPATIKASVIETALGSGHLTVNAGEITISEAIASTTAYNLTFKSQGSITQNSAISTQGGSVIFWADTDANGGYFRMNSGSGISTNGGHVWIGGGSGSASWNGLSVGNGYAIGTTTSLNGIMIDGSSISTGGGNIAMHGNSAQLSGTATGIRVNDNFSSEDAAINSGSGTILLDGISQGTQYPAGIEFNKNTERKVTITSANTTANAIAINAEGASANVASWGLLSYYNTEISATGNGGGISITGKINNLGGKAIGFVSTALLTGTRVLANGGPIVFNAITNGAGNSIYAVGTGMVVGQLANSAVPASTSNITINMDLPMTGTTTNVPDLLFNTSGSLVIQPITASTTFGIAGGAGTLQMPASLFATNFVNGFSNITIGSSTAGLISLGGIALSYNDPLTLKTGNSIFFNVASAVTGSNNALTLWSRAGGNDGASDGIDGSVWMPVGSSVNTGGGNITIGGGTNPATGYALGDNLATSAENNARYRGVTINGSLNAAGGNISILGKGDGARGVSIGSAVSTSGSGAITIKGIGSSTSDGIGLGDIFFNPDADGSIYAVNGTISLDGTKATGTNGINLSTAGSSISTTGTGALVMNSAGNIDGTGSVSIGGTTSLTAGTTGNITLNNASNAFTGVVTVVSGANVNLRNLNALGLGASTVSGNLILQTGGALTQTGALAVTGTSSITAGAYDVTFDNTANNFTGAVSVVSGANVSVSDANSMSIGTCAISGNLALTALGGDLTMTGNVTKGSGADATATLKASGNVLQNASTSINSSNNKLNVVVWADTDANGGGIHLDQNASIASNGGNVTLSGGTDYNTGYAIGTSSIQNWEGVLLQGSINSNGGNITLRGRAESASTPGNSSGIHIRQTGQLSAGAGNITLVGQVGATVTTDSNRGIWLGDGISSTTQAQLLTTTGAITLTGMRETGNGAGILLDDANLQTGSGAITLTGTQGTNEADVLLNAGTSGGTTSNTITSISGDITLNTNSLTLVGLAGFTSSGKLTFQPRTSATTIGIAGGAGTLQLPVGLFTTNFTDGFSQITIGSSQTGNINLNTIGFRDNMRLQTAIAGKVVVNANQTVSLNAGVNLTVDQDLELGAGAKLVK